MKHTLLKLVDSDIISIKSLAKIAKTNEIEIKNYLIGNYEVNRDNLQMISFLNQFEVLIEEGFKIDSDSRIKAIIDGMMLDYDFTLKQISLLINSDYKLVEEIFYSPSEMNVESKYEIAIKLYFLFYIIK